MKTYVHLWGYLAAFLLDREMFETEFLLKKQAFYSQKRLPKFAQFTS